MSNHDNLTTESDLRKVYSQPTKAVREKAFTQLDDHSRKFISLSPFFCIGSSRPDGLADVSPRGGDPGFVAVLDATRLAFPDRPGNNRLDTLTNVLHSSAVGLLFFIPGVEEMLRVNGLASVSTAENLMQRFVLDKKLPRSVIVIDVREVYLHCSKALKRSNLWNPETWPPRSALPTFGQMIRDQYKTIVPAGIIDLLLRRDAKKNLY